MAFRRVPARKFARRSLPSQVALLLSSLLFSHGGAVDTPRPGRFAVNDLEAQYGLLSSAPTTGVFNPAHWKNLSTGEVLMARGLVDGSVELARIADPTAPVAFTIASRDQFGNPYSAGANASPTFGDLDGDGSPELVVGNADGVLEVLEVSFTVGSGAGLLPITATLGSVYALLDAGDMAAPELVDFDNDGDLDLFVANGAGELLYGENSGSVSTPSPITAMITATTDTFRIGVPPYRATLEDLDGDGDIDGVWGAGDGSLSLIKNKPSGGAVGSIPLTINGSNFRTVPAPASPDLFDLDDDADCDIVLSNGNGEVGIMENIGSSALAGFTYTITLTNSGPSAALASHGGNAAPALHDIDNDGDLDMFFGTGDGSLVVSENEGTPETPSYITHYICSFETPVTWAGFHPAIGDIYGDGSSGILYGGSDGLLRMGHVSGSGGNFTVDDLGSAVGVNPFDAIDFGSDSAPALVDIDDDGDLDVFVCSDTCDISEGLPMVRNEGTDNNLAQGGTSDFTIQIVNESPSTGPMIARSAAFADMDDDGDFDAIIRLEGSDDPVYFENVGTTTEPRLCGKTDHFRTTPGPGLDVAIGDLDRDGIEDLVCASDSGSIETFNLDSFAVTIPDGDSVTTVPLGSSSVEVGFHVMTGDGSILRINKKQDTSSVAPPGGTYVEEYYELDGSALTGFDTVDLAFTYDPANANGVAGAVAFVIEDDGSTLVYHPDSSIGSTVTEVGNSVTVTGATGLSSWYIGGGPSAVRPGWELYQ